MRCRHPLQQRLKRQNPASRHTTRSQPVARRPKFTIMHCAIFGRSRSFQLQKYCPSTGQAVNRNVNLSSRHSRSQCCFQMAAIYSHFGVRFSGIVPMTNARIHRDFTPSGKLQHLSQWAHSCLAVPQRPAMLTRYETGLSPRSRTFRTNFCNNTGFPNYRDHRVPFVVWQPAFQQVAADSTTEPDPAVMFLCCARSQRDNCGMSEKLHAVAQQNIRPFVQVAAWIKRRTYRSRDNSAFRCGCAKDSFLLATLSQRATSRCVKTITTTAKIPRRRPAIATGPIPPKAERNTASCRLRNAMPKAPNKTG